jgi:hypothetical protein
MKERGGLTATVALLIAAIFGASYLPRKAAESAAGGESPAARSAGRNQPGSPVPAGKPLVSCEQIAKRLARFYSDRVPIPTGNACYPEGSQGVKIVPPVNPSLSFAIAIVPNPVQTHLPLQFDRMVEAVQQAAQDVNYSYDSSWFPWNLSDKSYESLSDEEQSAQLESDLQQQPGIMVFRRSLSDDQDAKPYGGGLVVFVVAEQPTGGVNDAQFEHALEWMSSLRAPADTGQLLIVGPIFSGSLSSLARLLETTKAFTHYSGIQIYSGSTNADANVGWFQNFLAARNPPELPANQGPPYRFRTFLESDSLMTDRFLCYLQHEGYDLNRVAILSEDQTAYGKAGAANAAKEPGPPMQSGATRCQGQVPGSDKANQLPIYLYYPRDIASLRAAYEKQSIFSAGKQQASAPSTSLHGSLSEPARSEHDSVRTYSGQLTPLAQEAVLFGITNVLDAKKTEFIILRSSNSLDQLFLSEFLRRSYPSGRVVIDGADLLFRRGMEGASLRGVMLLSTYPLLSWTQDAIPPIHGIVDGRSLDSNPKVPGLQKTSYRIFSQDLAEGTYIAARELFEQLPGASWTVPISDYGVPRTARSGTGSNDDYRPATWVSVVGHRQFWSIAVLNDNTEYEPDGCSGSQKDCKFGPVDPDCATLLEPEDPNTPITAGSLPSSVPMQKCKPAQLKAAAAPESTAEELAQSFKARRRGVRTLPGEMVALFVACIFLSLFHLGCCWKGSIIRLPRVRAYFAPIPRVQHTLAVFVGSVVLGFLGLVFGFVFWLGVDALTPLWVYATLAGTSVMVLAPVAGCALNYRLPIASGHPSESLRERIAKWQKAALVALPVILFLFSLIRYFYLTRHLTAANTFPAFWRSLNLRSGVSPLLPQVLLLGGFYAWFWFCLHGLALFGDDRPVLPKADDLPHMDVETVAAEHGKHAHKRKLRVFRVFSQEGAADKVERNALPAGVQYGKSLLFFIPVSICVLWVALGEHSLRTLGDRRFGSFIFFTVCLCIALILADTFQLLTTWGQLRRLLIYLDRTRLRRAFGQLKGFYSGSVWKISGNVLEERYRLISRQLESARTLNNVLSKWQTANPIEAECRRIALEHMSQCEARGREFVTWYVDLLDDTAPDSDKESNLKPLTEFQEMLAATAGRIMEQVILPAWQTETHSLLSSCETGEKDSGGHASSDMPPHVCAAEEFFVLPYLGFVQNTLGRVRTLAFSIVSMFVAVTLGVSCYPFDPLPVIGAVFLILFALVGASMISVYAEMSRDATLSRIANTNPGELGRDFWIKIATLGIGPLIGLLTTLFPSVTDFIVSFVQPGAQAIK